MDKRSDAELIAEAEKLAAWTQEECPGATETGTAGLAIELARRLKAKLEEEANWRAEVNRLNHLLANTAVELSEAKEKLELAEARAVGFMDELVRNG